MTHSDIKTKFLIEYDKADIASSYPSLTDYEIATILDRAYLALIAQKITGNNARRSSFESDIKSIEDLRPLIVTKQFEKVEDSSPKSTNEISYRLPSDLLYYIESTVCVDNTGIPQVTRLVTHEQANRFRETPTNKPWIPQPVAFLDNVYLKVLYDPFTGYLKFYKTINPTILFGTYLKQPKKFAVHSEENQTDPEETWSIRIFNVQNGSRLSNEDNQFLVEAYSVSSLGNISSVKFIVYSGLQYASISLNGTLTILPTDDQSYHDVTIRIVSTDDNSVQEELDLLVAYTRPANTSNQDDQGGSEGGGSDNTGTEEPETPPVLNPEVWQIKIENPVESVYNKDNKYTYTATCSSNYGRSSDVEWKIVSGSDYVSIHKLLSGVALLKVYDTATVYKNITITATCVEDRSKVDTTTVLVKYYQPQSTEPETEEDDIVVWQIHRTYDTNTINNENNSYTLRCTCDNNKGQTGHVIYTKRENSYSLAGNRYFDLNNTTGEIIILPTALDEYNTLFNITVRVTCVEDTSVYTDIHLYVRYYNNTQLTTTSGLFILDQSNLDGIDKLV